MRPLQILLLFAIAAPMLADCPVAFLAYPRDEAVTHFSPQSFSEQNGPFRYHTGTKLAIMDA